MNMSMFCFQCQEAARNIACEKRGVCGKDEDVAKLQDLLIYSLQGLSYAVITTKTDVSTIEGINRELIDSLFNTITNANFDGDAIAHQIKKIIARRDEIAKNIDTSNWPDAGTFHVSTMEEMIQKGTDVGILKTKDINLRSLRQMNIYGLKGMAAYAEHAANLGKIDYSIFQYMYQLLSDTLNDSISIDDWVKKTLETGEYGVKTMALLDEANTSAYGNPEITSVNIGVRNNPAILISGHDLRDLEQLLQQTQGTGVDVYTHCEMLPACSYPQLKKYDNLVGNYGGSWWQQVTEFEPFHGPILFTTNCIVPPRSEEVRKRIFTTGASGYPGCMHIVPNEKGEKDFTPIIEMAKTLQPPEALDHGAITCGFARNQVIELADKVVDAVKSGAIKKFFVMAGCDGRMPSRDYYTRFAKALPKDTVILTAGCAKFRYNKLQLGDIQGIPRVLDAGQCNDSYSLVVIALKLKEAFGLDDINQLPIGYNIAWYEQKAVIVFLALLSLGVKNIHLGPTLPAFLSPDVAKVIIDKFGVAGISTVEDDLFSFMNETGNTSVKNNDSYNS
ncbi:MAG: hydroxylamine reductase [Dorea formicigenerans]